MGEEELPRALVIDFERFIPYRGGGRNPNFYNRMRPYAGASDAVTGRRVVALFNKNFNDPSLRIMGSYHLFDRRRLARPPGRFSPTVNATP